MDRRRLREVHQALSDLLDREWDPIGVYGYAPGLSRQEWVDGEWRDLTGPVPTEDQPPPGEYDTYAGWILSALQRGGDVAAVLECMTRARDWMGLGASPETDRRVADLIMDWWR